VAKKNDQLGKGGEQGAGVAQQDPATTGEGSQVDGGAQPPSAPPPGEIPPAEKEGEDTEPRAVAFYRRADGDPFLRRWPTALAMLFMQRAQAAEKGGDFASHAQLHEIAVAIGSLKVRLLPARGRYGDEIGDMIENLYDVL
jgi:hypothetical protein